MKHLIAELNDLLANNGEFNSLTTDDEKRQYKSKLTEESRLVYSDLPKGIAKQLTLDRDPHGNVQVSLIETEKMLIEMVAKKLAALKAQGIYKGKFAAIHHFFGYEGRCAAPSNFDTDYCYSLGYTASILIAENKTGYMSSVRNLTESADQWIAGGVPITMMMNMERRHGEMKPVIQKALSVWTVHRSNISQHIALNGLMKTPATFIRVPFNIMDLAKYVTNLPVRYFWNKAK